jgi:predicted esterase
MLARSGACAGPPAPSRLHAVGPGSVWLPGARLCWDPGVVVVPPLSHTVVRRDGDGSRLMVLLHGYGEPASDLTDRLDLIDPSGRFVVAVPQAPFARRGRRNWHGPMSGGLPAQEQFLASQVALDDLLGALESDLGLAASDAVVGGFSQGGGLALGLLLGADVRHRPAAGFGVCSFPPFVQGYRVDRSAVAGRPYFLSSARQDHFASIDMSRSCAALLCETGMDLTYVESDGAHEMTDTAAAQIGAWLAAVGRGEPGRTDDLPAGAVGSPGIFDELWELAD